MAPLHIAVEKERIEIVRLLLQKPDLDINLLTILTKNSYQI